jgi:hypothetical protein
MKKKTKPNPTNPPTNKQQRMQQQTRQTMVNAQYPPD